MSFHTRFNCSANQAAPRMTTQPFIVTASGAPDVALLHRFSSL
jgi:hypothetical protein